MSPGEIYLQKSKKLVKMIKLFNMPLFTPKSKSEKNDTSRVSAKKPLRKLVE